jgi:ATP-dependent Lon protease
MTIKDSKSQSFYALPLRDVVIFPNTTTTILVGREKSINSIEEAKKINAPIFAIAQTNPDHDDFEQKNLHDYGVLCYIVETSKTPDGVLKVILQGTSRAKLTEVIPSEVFFFCQVKICDDSKFSIQDKELIGLIKNCIETFEIYSNHNKRITQDVISALSKSESPYDLVYSMAVYISSGVKNKQKILAEDNPKKKMFKILEILKTEIEISEAEARINKSIQEKITKSQKEFYLNEQIKNIKKELGQDEENEFKELKEKISKIKLPKEVSEKCNSELNKLEKMNPYSSESGVVRNYLDWICDLPWNEKTKVNNDINKAQKILDKHHYGLKKIKDRILEFIAVQIKTKNPRGPILCLVGAPGVGKTSLAKSIAESLNRKYVKISLGGVRDESEIRGHRRTYIGAMPGRIIQSMKKAKVVNPIILLDEIDKMSLDFRGDPAAALLEVLDPEQNNSFSDHYMEIDYDLSQVMFVATANSLAEIPIPLRDRMEIIRLSGYTENEKLHIAKEHLVKKQCEENGLSEKEFSVSDGAILTLIRRYTFEAGVRNLNREIANLARKVTRKIISKELKSLKIDEKNLHSIAGPEKHNYGRIKKSNLIGVATGLAFTEYGGDLLDIEVLKFEGSGKIQITGKLGEVMKESAQTALSYARSISKKMKIDAKKFNKYDFHIHVPEGATPKDGPSAGIAICVALVSALTDIPIRRDVAMTGEITLTGKALEIGGLKEKLLAALRGGIKTVLIPEENKKDLEEMPKEIIDKLIIKPISQAKEALKECLVNEFEK